jgi:SulP family sulfate permease
MSPLVSRFLPFLAWRDRVNRETLRADLIAGLVGALVVLPQAVAYATLAGLPPEFGLYAAMLPVAVAALWGSSWHQVSGPTNTLSLAVIASVGALALPGSPKYITLVLTLALMVGVIELAMGLARLGTLVNFISQTVIVGFTAGAGLLIVAGQLSNFFGTPPPPGPGFLRNVADFAQHIGAIDYAVTGVALATTLLAIVSRRMFPRVPYMIVAMIGGSALAWLLADAGIAQVPTAGALRQGPPPLSLPSFALSDWRDLAPSALALTVLALAQAVSVARAVAAESGQRIDGNQEFIGQGLSNIVAAFSTGYPSSGSFNRIWLNYRAGARTPLAAAFSALFLLAIVVVVAPLGRYLPLAVMAALLFVVAWGLIDIAEIRRTVRTSRGETLVLALTFVATLALQIEFAILVGVLASLLVYLKRTTRPRVVEVAPDPASPSRRLVPSRSGMGTPARATCPQLSVLRIDGSLFFGAIDHVRDELHLARMRAPERRHMLIVASSINFIDVAGARMLVDEARLAAEHGQRLYLASLKPGAREVLERSGYLESFGRDRVFDTEEDAIRSIYAALDPAVCASCTARIFTECASRPPDGVAAEAPPEAPATSAGRSP